MARAWHEIRRRAHPVPVRPQVLLPSLAADRDRLARFQREAEVLASLNHPNIAAIYGLEESEGITALVTHARFLDLILTRPTRVVALAHSSQPVFSSRMSATRQHVH